MIDHVPEMYADFRGMEVDFRQLPLWRVTEEETYKPRSGKTVEDWLTSLRKKNLKEKEEVTMTARRIKQGFWLMHGGRPSRDLRHRAGDKLKEQHSVAKAIRFSPGQTLPAEACRAPLLEKINRAMKNLDESNADGIVLLVGGTGCGKSSVSPPALYVDTILEAHGRDQKGDPFLSSELRPGGRILVTEPRKALTLSMVNYLKNMNRQHEFLFGYQYAGASSSQNHDEAILYMTDGIAVAHLMGMVSDVMTMVHREKECPCREGVLDPSVIEGIKRIPWDPEFPLIVIDECHLRSVNCDLTIALVRWLQSVGVPIVLLLMSATANESDFTEKLKLTSDMLVSIQGQTHPVSRFLLGQTISCSLRGKPDDPPPG
eukprot:2626681-Amphidinium_carterae.1